jgi:hypothetical protein
LRLILHLLAAVALLPAGTPEAGQSVNSKPDERPPGIPEEIAELQRTSVIDILPAAEDMPARLTGKRTRAMSMKRDSVVLAMTPLADVEFARIRAVLPDRRVLLLAEIRNFRKADDRILVYRDPVRLPKGARIVSEPPVPLELLLEKKTK